MFRISKLTDYGIVVMTYLAENQEGLYSAKDIAEATQLTLPTVTKLLKVLTREALLNSQRGVTGGYSLAKSPDQITVAAIIQAIEGNLGLTDCAAIDSQCTLEPVCHTRRTWRLISQVIHDALDSITLGQMATPMTPINLLIQMNQNQVENKVGENHD